MKGPVITTDKVETILDKKFIRVFDLQYYRTEIGKGALGTGAGGALFVMA